MTKHWKGLSADERTAAIIKIHPTTTGTGAAIAAALSGKFRVTISRNAVISHYNRHAAKLVDVPLTGKAPAISEKVEKAREVAKARVKKPSGVLLRTGGHFAQPHKIAPAPVKPVVVQPAAPLVVPEPLNLKLFELGSNQCKWPVSGEREHTLFCGAVTRDQKSYCDCHHKMSVGLGSQAERNAVPRRIAA
ncbi:GcrA family cell cycle regulator [Agrobacterium tumefaciens]|uniref:GcrA family cell cycle regulator n=1 Tax=Agrobacterium tumefaciens TaxID=358 RepID=UPI0021D32EF6|nr:GcrA family cell cycle regulator [Agrobacterium tumefaciens]UXS01114.1 hypothetical protein FY156_06215 [Agrobacterium tumefaciens]